MARNMQPKSDGARGDKLDERKDRLAAALRENLKRRKAQDRARATEERQTNEPPEERSFASKSGSSGVASGDPTR